VISRPGYPRGGQDEGQQAGREQDEAGGLR
jgi:hypothetical protein